MIKIIVVNLGKLSYLLLGWLLNTIHRICNGFNTGYYSQGLAHAGKGISIEYPTEKFLNKHYISIGDYTTISKRAVITAHDRVQLPYIIIGSGVIIGDDCHITSINSITIGDGTLLGKKVTITDNSHGKNTFSELFLSPIKREVFSKGPVVIGKNVWIGDKVTICPGITIGDGAIIGANSVVTHDVQSYTIVAGSPARIIKQITE